MASSSLRLSGMLRVTREGQQVVELSIEQLTPRTVATVFSLDPTTVWLRQEPPGNRAFFPDSTNSRFMLDDEIGFLINDLVAMGSSTTSNLPPVLSAGKVLPGPTASDLPISGILPQQTQFSARKTQSTNVKIVQASMKYLPNGKIEFSAQNQTFIDVTEATANLHYVTSAIQCKWGQEFIIVTSDGLKLDDCSGTQGLKFWKVGSRKLYAVNKSELKERKRTSHALVNLSSSSSDDEFVTTRAKRRCGRLTDLSIFSNIPSDLMQVKHSLDIRYIKIFSLTSTMTIPVGLKKLLYDTFKCSICQSTPMMPPIIFAKCCKSILGCQLCVDTWYRGEEGQTRTCPKCRSDRAYVQTCKLNGMDEFLLAIAPLIGHSHSTTTNDDAEHDQQNRR